jgi:signal transduction histidine kinase
MADTREQAEERTTRPVEIEVDGEALSELTRLAHVRRLCMLGELSAALSHELNQPLTTILAIAEIWARQARSGSIDAEEFVRDADIVSHETKRAASLVARVRGFARQDPPHRSAFCVNELARDVAELLVPVCRSPRIEVDLRLEEPLPALVGDRVLIHQVILNLLMNAIEAAIESPPAARGVSVTTRSVGPGERVEIVIEDTGPPLEKTDLARAFEPFHTTKKSGIGLGLALARRIIEDHDGTISLEVVPGGGARATLVLPVMGDEP